MIRSKAALVALAGSTIALIGGVAAAQPTVISISGATLLENFLRARASTIDYIDADGDGNARVNGGFSIDQLAPFAIPAPFPDNQTWLANQHWVVLYQAVGSTNGLQELITFGRTFTTLPGTNTDPAVSMRISARTAAFYNRSRYINAGTATQDNTGSTPNPEVPPALGSLYNANNPGGAPVRAIISGPNQFKALYTSPGLASTSPNEGITETGGLTVDIAPLDVPVSWAVVQTGTAASTRKPKTAGYGNNAGNPVDADGARRNAGSRQTTLATLTGGANLFDTAVTPNANTIFDTAILIAPVAPTINFGIGFNQFDQADIRHLFTTGRQRDGENLIVVTRDSGSGTRNAWDNSNGIDPSWANGDNAGVRNNGPQFDRLGPIYVPSNKQGNNRVEGAVINNRLAIGYVGPERGLGSDSDATISSWLQTGKAEIGSVRNSLYGGTLFVRPTLDNLLDNGPNGWVISGPGVLASFGDPASAPAAKGGLGWNGTETRPSTLNPAMRNVEAAAYINNIKRSITSFSSLPGADETVFTPGEFASTQYILNGAADFVRQSTPTIDPTVLVPNPGLNQTLQDYIRFQSGNVLGNSAYAAFGNRVAPNSSASRAGKVPNRSTYAANDSRTVAQGGTTSTAAVGTLFASTTASIGDAQRLFVTNFRYSDAALVPAGDKYITQDGTLLSYTNNLPLRNAVAGDFNADGLRNAADIPQLVAAWQSRNGGAAWVSPNASGALAALATTTFQAANPGDAVIEILGDFNGDGSFTKLDVRYFADGLALVTDVSSPTGRRLDRKAGFTAVDVAFAGNFFGTALATPKAYAAGDARGDVFNRLARVAPGYAPIGADSGNAFDSASSSADTNRVDGYDISYVQAQFRRNSAVSDGALNWSNYTEATGLVTLPNPTGTAVATSRADLSGDITGDGIVNQADVVELVTNILGTTLGDVNLDGATNAADLVIVDASIATPPAAQNVFWGNGDLTGDGVVNAADRNIVIAALCPNPSNVSGPGQNTTALDAELTADDIIVFLNRFFAGNLASDVSGPGQNTTAIDGELTADDIIVFLNRFFAGC
ncbi:MAG: GC-type dockerin domain-anchored protein [bacterium]